MALPPNISIVLDHGGGKTYPHQKACMYCNVLGGFLWKCCGSNAGIALAGQQTKQLPCHQVFHPLCAWVNGACMQAEITDVTFQGSERDNVYPSGLDFQYYCQEHAPSGHEDKAYRKTQLELRGKYLIKEVELDGIPGHNRRSRKSGSSSRRPNAAPRKKEPIRDLPPDSYRNLRACCVGPIQGFGALELEDREKMELLGDQAEVGADVAVGVGANASEVKTEVPFSSIAMEGVSSSVSVSAGTSTGPDTAGTGAAVVVKLEPESSILPLSLVVPHTLCLPLPPSLPKQEQ